jgi:hypothetical protein
VRDQVDKRKASSEGMEFALEWRREGEDWQGEGRPLLLDEEAGGGSVYVGASET